jgi:DNA repair protein RecO (recombination protein O)
MIVTTEALVLRTMKYRDSSLIATLLTRTAGKISVLGKGARDRKSRMASTLLPMNHVTAVYYWKESRDLQLLTHCDTLRPHGRLTDTLEKMAAGLAAVELADAVSPVEQENIPLFDALASTLAAINDATKHPENALYHYEMRMLEAIGFRVDFGKCCRCGTPLNLDEAPRGVVLSANGVLCQTCSGMAPGWMSLSPAALRVLQRLQEIDDPAAATRLSLATAVRGEVTGALRRILLAHVEGLRTLRTEAVFSSLI